MRTRALPAALIIIVIDGTMASALREARDTVSEFRYGVYRADSARNSQGIQKIQHSSLPTYDERSRIIHARVQSPKLCVRARARSRFSAPMSDSDTERCFACLLVSFRLAATRESHGRAKNGVAQLKTILGALSSPRSFARLHTIVRAAPRCVHAIRFFRIPPSVYVIVSAAIIMQRSRATAASNSSRIKSARRR